MILGVVKHLGLVIPMVDDLMGKEKSSYVVPTVSFMDFLHHLSSLLRIEASQIQVGVEAGIGFFV